MVEVGDGGRGSMCCMNVQMEAAVQLAGRGCSWRFRQGIRLHVFARKLAGGGSCRLQAGVGSGGGCSGYCWQRLLRFFAVCQNLQVEAVGGVWGCT